jgi:phosphatidylglycerol:prolipoprotein diacylglycerol transferase
VNAGLLLGAALALREARRREIALVALIDVMLAAALGGLILARAAYVGARWDYYADHMRRAVRPWKGGLFWQGALLGGMAGAAVASAVRGLPLWTVLDVLTPGAASLPAFAWLACFMVGCAWGIETFPGQPLLWALSLDLPDIYGIHEPRVAVQLLGAGWSAFLLGLIVVFQRFQHRLEQDGIIFSLWLTLHSFSMLGLGCLRGEELPSVAGWRVDQMSNLALGIIGTALLLSLAVSRDRG